MTPLRCIAYRVLPKRDELVIDFTRASRRLQTITYVCLYPSHLFHCVLDHFDEIAHYFVGKGGGRKLIKVVGDTPEPRNHLSLHRK